MSSPYRVVRTIVLRRRRHHVCWAIITRRLDPEDGSTGSPRRAGPLLASAYRRADPVRCLPALLQAARGPARPVLRARATRRRDRAHHLWALVRLLHRSDREEAAQSFPPRDTGAVVRHRGLQSHLQVL